MDMIGNCKDCIFYEVQNGFNAHNLEFNDNCGECKFIADSFEENKLMVLNGGGYDSTLVGKNFGCIHFKQKQ
jgi:hypothetical protein